MELKTENTLNQFPVSENSSPGRQNNQLQSRLLQCLQSPDIWDIFGIFSTLLYVAPPGLYSALFVDNFFKDSNIALRIIADGITGFTSMAGRYALMRKFNTEVFRSIPVFTSKKNSECLNRDTPGHLFTYTVTAATSATFTYLGCLSLYYTAELARKDNNHAANQFADVVNSLPLKVFIATGTVISSSLSFSSIIPKSFTELKIIFLTLSSSIDNQQTYLNEQAKITRSSNKLISAYTNFVLKLKKSLVDDNDIELIDILKTLFNIDESIEQTQAPIYTRLSWLLDKVDLENSSAIRSSLVNFNHHTEGHLPPSLLSYRFAILSTLFLTIITSIGFSNFFQISKNFGNYAELGDASVIISIPTMIGIVALAMTTLRYKLTFSGLFDSSLSREPISLVEYKLRQAVNLLGFAICVLAATSNVYQSLALANQHIILVISAFIASVATMLPGTSDLLQDAFNKRTLKKLTEQYPFITKLHQLATNTSYVSAEPPKIISSNNIYRIFTLNKKQEELREPLLLRNDAEASQIFS